MTRETTGSGFEGFPASPDAPGWFRRAVDAPYEGRSSRRGVEAPQQQSFGDMVKEFAGDVNALQFEAGHAIDQFVTGEAADVHQVMVAVEQAGIAMDLMLEIRNRVLDGYQELIRMQV